MDHTLSFQGQTFPETRFEQELHQLSHLKNMYGVNKEIPAEYELPVYTALSLYPELIKIKIKFLRVNSVEPLSCRPSWLSALLPPRWRNYIIRISENTIKSREPALLKNMPFDEQVANIGHELGHVVDYLHRSGFELLKYGILFPFDGNRRDIEQAAELNALKHGLAQPMLNYARRIEQLKKKYPQDTYYANYEKYYMSAWKIEQYIDGGI